MATQVLQTKTQLTAELQAKLATIDAWNLENVRERVAREGAVQQSLLDAAVREYRKWMALIVLGNRGLGMISPEVDEVWHAHILFTRDYHAFCDAINGAYVHHQPATSSAPIGPEAGQRFKRAYNKHYGRLPKVWRRKATVLAGCADGCSDCSADCSACSASCDDATPTLQAQINAAECSDCSSCDGGDCSACSGDCGDE